MAEGDIGAIIDSLVFDAGLGARADIIHVSGDVYAIAYQGVDNDGFVCTVSVDSLGEIGAAVIDSFEFATDDGFEPSIIHISDDVYAIAYGGVGRDGFVCTVSIDSLGEIGAAVIDSFVFDSSWCFFPSIIHVFGDVYAIAYQGYLNDGWLATVSIDSAGEIGAARIDCFEFDAADGRIPSIVHIVDDVYAIAHRAGGNSGKVRTVSIDSLGEIGAAVIDSFTFEATTCYNPKIMHVSGDVYAIAYQGGLSVGLLVTVSIDSVGEIGAAVIDSFTFDAGIGNIPDIMHVSGDVYAIAYQGSLSVGKLVTVSIDSAGEIGAAVIDSGVFDAVYGADAEIVHVSGNVYAIAYQDTGAGGKIETITIETILPDAVKHLMLMGVG